MVFFAEMWYFLLRGGASYPVANFGGDHLLYRSHSPMKEMVVGCVTHGLIMFYAVACMVSDVFASHSGSNLSDHSPLFFRIHADCRLPTCLPLSSFSRPFQHLKRRLFGLRFLQMMLTVTSAS